MSEATVTIIRKNPPGPGKKMWELVAETGEKFKAWDSEAGLFDEGKRYRLNFEQKDFNGFAYKQIKGAPKLLEGQAPSRPGSTIAAPHSSDPGPYIGMWEKLASDMLKEGMAESDIVVHGVKVRKLAVAIVGASLEEKPDTKVVDDLNDSLEF